MTFMGGLGGLPTLEQTLVRLPDELLPGRVLSFFFPQEIYGNRFGRFPKQF